MDILSHGVINGNIIELQNNLGFPKGLEVDVIVKTPAELDSGGETRYPPGKRALNWTEQDDRILEELYRQRQADTGREIPE